MKKAAKVKTVVCAACGRTVPRDELPPYRAHATGCSLAAGYPSAASLREMPPADFSRGTWKRRSPERVAKMQTALRKGVTILDGAKRTHKSYEQVMADAARIGRPKRGEAARPTVTRAVRLAPELWSALKAKADKDGVPLNAVVRSAVLKLLKAG